MAAPNRPTPEQIDEFNRYMREWQSVLGLKSWRIEKVPSWSTAMAEVSFNDEARLATYKVGNFGATPVNERSLNETALHECLHILLHDLIIAAESKDDARLESAEHAVINVLEKLLMQSPENVWPS